MNILALEMATLLKSDITAYSTPEEEICIEAFMPEDTLDQPCDVILVVKDGKELKAHRRVLSEASPFFEKAFNSGMKESKEGIVQLETFAEPVVRNTLEFIYTGDVQILTDENALDLIVMADYLFLQNLKTLAEDLIIQNLNTSNCISTYFFSERYQCEELSSRARKFILANFSAAWAANREEILNVSSEQVQMWIASDDLNVSAEEDVFNFILAWIDHDTSKRRKYFAELFRRVRLLYVSRDFLSSDVMTNDLVNDNEDCLDLVADAMRLIESKTYDSLSVIPRKSLTTPVLVALCSSGRGPCNINCYFPREDRWHKLAEMPGHWEYKQYLVSCRGKIYRIPVPGLHPGHIRRLPQGCPVESYDPYSNSWMSLNYKEERDVREIFVANDEMYAFVSEPCDDCWRYYIARSQPKSLFPFRYMICDKEKHVSFITKYKPESNSWEDISSFDHIKLKRHLCIVANDNFIYIIGGNEPRNTELMCMNGVDRYDLSKNQWDRVADAHTMCLAAAAVNGMVVIAEGIDWMGKWRCEMFREATNEWQFIPRFGINRLDYKLLSIDGVVYVLPLQTTRDNRPYQRQVECYDPDKNQWNPKTKIPANMPYVRHACSMRIFKEFLDNKGKETSRLKCFIM